MPYSFQGIGTMSSALKAAQVQLDVTGENISNADTVGFHRRKVTLAQNPYTEVTVGRTVEIGNGVSVAGVSRVRDMFLAGRRTEAGAKMGRQEEALTGLSKIQSAMLEPGSEGISSAYDDFTNSWSALSASPGSVAAKTDVQAAGAKLAGRVSSFARELQAQRSDSMAQTKEVLGKIDAATSRISELNKQIAEARARGGEPNSLLDMRDQVVQDLTGLADVTVTTGDGNVDVSLNGYRLVDPSGARTVSSNYDMATGRIVDGSVSFPVNGGALAGKFDTRSAIDATAAKLDTFADALRSQVNGLFSTGKTASGATGGTFFEEPTPPLTSITAADFKLSAAVAADPNNIPSGTSGLSGDGVLAAQISSLRDEKIAGLGNQTMGAFYADLVTDVATKTALAQDGVDTQDAVIKQLDAQISSTDGVSMDDEMANMLRFQRSYQAAAKALSVFDQVTETVINMLNR